MSITAPSATLPTTEEAIELLGDLRRELRFDERFDRYVAEPVRFVVRGVSAPAAQPNLSPGTACWSFRGTSPGSHLIHFCLTALEKLLPGADWRGYLTAYAHHEFLHACLTERDLQAFSKRLKREGLPFSLFNLFEDARIEARGRSRDFGFPMKWLAFEALTAAEKPRGYFFNLIQNEGIDSADLLATAVHGAPWVARVRDHYYARVVKARATEDTIALMKEWIAEFPEDAGSTGEGPGWLTELLHSLGISEAQFAEAIEQAREQAGEARMPDVAQGSGQGEPDGIVLEPDASNHPVVHPHPVRTVDHALAEKAAERLRALLLPGARRERTCHPAKRISVRAYAQGRPDFYRRKSEASSGRPIKIAFLFDCSGSMSGCADGGLAIVMGLNLLAQRGQVSGHLILHKGERKALCASYKLPLPADFFARIPTDGGCEAIEPALRKSLPLLKAADYIFCYTDGCICDAPIDKAWVAGHGLRPIGLYCGDESMAVSLKNWFSCALIRPTPLDLLEALVATVDFKSYARK